MTKVLGVDLTHTDILETLSFFDSWEERYKYIIDLGKELPELDHALKSDDCLVRGCQSQVWLIPRQQGDHLYFDVDSDAHIVKGLLAVVLAAYNGKTPEQILKFDIESYFSQLDLLKHLSPTRGNGLRSMVKTINQVAAKT